MKENILFYIKYSYMFLDTNVYAYIHMYHGKINYVCIYLFVEWTRKKKN